MNPRSDPPNLASLLAKLRNRARADGLPPELMLLFYFHEGFLARLAASRHSEQFILKGGLNLYSRYRGVARPTRDIDLAGRGIPNTVEAVLQAVGEIASLDLGDGVVFDLQSLKGEAIQQEAAYLGIGLQIIARFADASETIQMDVSFGNAITPEPVVLEFPSLIGKSMYRVLGYPLQTIVAEKFAAAVEIGLGNTRLKDFYDLHHILTRESLEPKTLRQALERTFKARGTLLEGNLERFLEMKDNPNAAARWVRFLQGNRLEAPAQFSEVIEAIAGVIRPALE